MNPQFNPSAGANIPRPPQNKNPITNGDGQSGPALSNEERDLIKSLSSRCKEEKEKDPTFDSKKFLQNELTRKCGPTRTSEIMSYMQKMTRSRQSAPPDAIRQQQQQQQQAPTIPFNQPPSAPLPIHTLNSRVPPPIAQSGPYLSQLPAFTPGPRATQTPAAAPVYPNRPQQPPHLQMSSHPPRGTPMGGQLQGQGQVQGYGQGQGHIHGHPHGHGHGHASGHGEIIHRKPENSQQQQHQQHHHQQHHQQQQQQQHGVRVDHGLDTAPTLEELGADPTTLTNNLMQVNVLTDRDIHTEFEAADMNLRQSVKNDTLIPAVGTRPGINSDHYATRRDNVLDEAIISSLFNQIKSTQQPVQTLTSEAARILSEGIQIHLTHLIDASIIHSRKRTNRTATEHFLKSQQLIGQEFPHSGVGEVMPENRGNLGMLWGPPLLEELEEYAMKSRDQYHEKRARLTESIKQELTADEEKRLQKKKGQGTAATAAEIVKDSWWIRDDKARENGAASLEDIAMSRLRLEISKKYELGPNNTRKKPRKEGDMEEEEVTPVDSFAPTYKPNQQILYENTPLSKATWRQQRCPLTVDRAAFSTITRADVISAISRSRGNDLASTRGTWEFGTALRIAKTVSKR